MTHTSTALITLLLLLSGSTVPAQRKFENSPDAHVLGDFKARVEKYEQLRNKADDYAPPLKQSNSAAAIKDAQHALAERVGVKPGDLFTPEISTVFKRLLRPEAQQHDTKEVMKEDKPVAPSFKVNGPYPEGPRRRCREDQPDGESLRHRLPLHAD